MSFSAQKLRNAYLLFCVTLPTRIFNKSNNAITLQYRYIHFLRFISANILQTAYLVDGISRVVVFLPGPFVTFRPTLSPILSFTGLVSICPMHAPFGFRWVHLVDSILYNRFNFNLEISLIITKRCHHSN